MLMSGSLPGTELSGRREKQWCPEDFYKLLEMSGREAFTKF